MKVDAEHQKRVAEIKKQTYQFALKAFSFFAITAVTAAFIGKAIDNQFGIAPYGSLAIFMVFFVLSWVIAFRLNKSAEFTKPKRDYVADSNVDETKSESSTNNLKDETVN